LPASYGDKAAELLSYYASKARAANTARTYRTQWQHFRSWCGANSRPFTPAAPETIALYLAERAQSGAAISTIAVALAAIRFAHDQAGAIMQRDDPLLRLVVDGIRREHVRPQRQAEPLRQTLLDEILSCSGATAPERRGAALLALLFVFALRASEAVALDWMRVGDGRGWLRIDGDVVEVGLCGSKGASQAVERVAVPTHSCQQAVTAIRKWGDLAQIAEGQPILRALARGGSVRPERLHAHSISSIVKRTVAQHLQSAGTSAEEAQVVAARFSGHSGRVGLYVSATEAGVPAQRIAALARHKSLSMALRYAQRANLLALSPHQPGARSACQPEGSAPSPDYRSP
jgi:site-specific recombinase XerC